MLRAQHYYFIKNTIFYGLTGVTELKIGDKFHNLAHFAQYFISLITILGSCVCVSGRGLELCQFASNIFGQIFGFPIRDYWIYSIHKLGKGDISNLR